MMLALLSLYSFVSMSTGIHLVGHRGTGCSLPGCISDIPENSLEAFATASTEMLATRMELDVWLSADDKVVVMHGGQPYQHGDLKESVVKGLFKYIELSNYDSLSPNSLHTPWVKTQKHKTAEEAALHYYKSPKLIKDLIEGEYILNKKPSSQKLPLFEEVLETVCLRKEHPKIQVEMKGLKPQLGLRVLEFAEKYPDCIGGISSFQWNPPHCTLEYSSNLEICPNGFVKDDLLKPVIDKNVSGIPVGLLFNTVPKDSMKILRFATFMKAHEVHMPHSSAMTGQLKEISSLLHTRQFKVMSWTPGHHADTEQELQKCIDSDVDYLCTNNLHLAKRLVQRKKRSQ